MAKSSGKTATIGMTESSAESSGCQAGGKKPTSQCLKTTKAWSRLSVISDRAFSHRALWPARVGASLRENQEPFRFGRLAGRILTVPPSDQTKELGAADVRACCRVDSFILLPPLSRRDSITEAQGCATALPWVSYA